jgi:hypothetical protein
VTSWGFDDAHPELVLRPGRQVETEVEAVLVQAAGRVDARGLAQVGRAGAGASGSERI